MRYAGRCHCGAIGFSYETRLSPRDWQVRACQCAFCRAHGVLTTSDPAGLLTFHANDPEQLSRYRFALRLADFLVCRTCGVYVGASTTAANHRYGILNVNALEPRPAELPQPQQVSHATETASERIERRKERWTPLTGGV
jgi:hypothetical protein